MKSLLLIFCSLILLSIPAPAPQIVSPAGATSIPIAAVVNLTAQQAAIGTTTLFTPTAAGYFRFSCYVVLTQPATTSSTVGQCQVLYTDSDSNAAQTNPVISTSTNNANGTVPPKSGVIVDNTFFAKASTPIQYNVAYASVGATPMQYAVHIRLEGPF